MSLAATASTVLAAFRANADGVSMIRGVEWHEVHLDDCIPAGMLRHVFTGCLGALKLLGCTGAQRVTANWHWSAPPDPSFASADKLPRHAALNPTSPAGLLRVSRRAGQPDSPPRSRRCTARATAFPPRLAREVERFRADHRIEADEAARAFLVALGIEAAASMARPELLRRLINAGAAADEPKRPAKR